jgi:hypothetical protein
MELLCCDKGAVPSTVMTMLSSLRSRVGMISRLARSEDVWRRIGDEISALLNDLYDGLILERKGGGHNGGTSLKEAQDERSVHI